jgi:hypothetical protein
MSSCRHSRDSERKKRYSEHRYNCLYKQVFSTIIDRVRARCASSPPPIINTIVLYNCMHATDSTIVQNKNYLLTSKSKYIHPSSLSLQAWKVIRWNAKLRFRCIDKKNGLLSLWQGRNTHHLTQDASSFIIKLDVFLKKKWSCQTTTKQSSA